jgi:flagellar P-ring protein precursor FlgI
VFSQVVRIKDVARLKDVRPNQLMGYGLVVGLNGTGDSKATFFTAQSVVNMLKQLGMTVDKEQMTVKNVAAVMVTAQLPSFARVGDRFDVMVSSIGDAGSLEGGVLLQTPLFGADNQIYGVAQGAVVLGSKNAEERAFATVGRIPAGAIVEREVTCNLVKDGTISFALKEVDFTNASRLAECINARFGKGTATAVDASLVEVKIPKDFGDRVVEFISQVEGLKFKTDSIAKVVINERTGTVVMGENVRISSVIVSHGELSLTVKEKVPGKEEFREKHEKAVVLPTGATVDEIVKALNAIGASPQDIVTLLQAIKEAGALHAELVVM